MATDIEEIIEVEEKQLTDLEKLAGETGWAPKEEWRGDEASWVDAATFIRQGQLNLKSTLRSQDNKLSTMQTTLEEFKTHYTNVEKKAYDRAIASLRTRQREAVEEGDTDAFDAVTSEIDALGSEIADTSQSTKADPNKADPNFDSWHPNNKWYNTDVFLTAKADSEIAPAVAKMFPSLVGSREFYDKITDEIKKAYPERFTNPDRARAAVAEDGGGGVTQAGRSAKKDYAALPAEAKDACDRFVKQGLMTREDYVKDYEWD